MNNTTISNETNMNANHSIGFIIESVQKHLIGAYITEVVCNGKTSYQIVKDESVAVVYGSGSTPTKAWRNAYFVLFGLDEVDQYYQLS